MQKSFLARLKCLILWLTRAIAHVWLSMRAARIDKHKNGLNYFGTDLAIFRPRWTINMWLLFFFFFVLRFFCLVSYQTFYTSVTALCLKRKHRFQNLQYDFLKIMFTFLFLTSLWLSTKLHSVSIDCIFVLTKQRGNKQRIIQAIIYSECRSILCVQPYFHEKNIYETWPCTPPTTCATTKPLHCQKWNAWWKIQNYTWNSNLLTKEAAMISIFNIWAFTFRLVLPQSGFFYSFYWSETATKA